MKKIVINRCFGGFGLSHEGVMHYAKLKGIEVYAYHDAPNNYHGAYGDRPMMAGPGKDLFTHYATKPDLKTAADLNGCCFNETNILRDDPDLVRTVEELGEQADGDCAELKVVEIPDDAQWEIAEYDGNEHIAECHQTWY